MFHRLLREPLVHFLVLGGLLFGMYQWLGGAGDAVQDVVRRDPVDGQRCATPQPPHPPCRRPLQANQNPDQRRLARTILARHSKNRPRWNIQDDSLQRGTPPQPDLDPIHLDGHTPRCWTRQSAVARLNHSSEQPCPSTPCTRATSRQPSSSRSYPRCSRWHRR